ncbi:MAG: LysM peptidoglycan-binding domain-containing protein [Oscillospiraceae bacterium]|jgi:LysM repeat protein|nr:LysM peptidoglycan-binding domain-containing protein [Oscillospiraceae bacterium]
MFIPKQLYYVRPGRSLGDIAEFFGVDKNEILRVNLLKSEKQITIGQCLVIPNGKQVKALKPKTAPKAANYCVAGATQQIIDLTKEFGITMEDFFKANHINSLEEICEGEVLKLF